MFISNSAEFLHHVGDPARKLMSLWNILILIARPETSKIATEIPDAKFGFYTKKYRRQP